MEIGTAMELSSRCVSFHLGGGEDERWGRKAGWGRRGEFVAQI